MTNRYDTLTVILEEPIREDDLENWIKAITLMDKVISVETGRVDDIALKKAQRELKDELLDIITSKEEKIR
jgi:hypothetical protein